MTYFVRTRYVGSDVKFFALEGQQLQDGTPVSTEVAIDGAKGIRSRYAVGTIFASEKLTGTGTRYFLSKDVCPMDVSVRSQDQRPNAEMQRDWNDYKRVHGEPKPLEEEMAGLFADEGGLNEKAAADAKRGIDGMKAGETVLEAVRRMYPRPTLDKDGFYVDQDVWELMTRNVVRGKHTLVYGCQGLGKSELVEMVGRKMGKTVRRFDMGAIQDPLAQLLGTHRLVAEGGHTVSKFDRAEFSYAIENEGIVFLDEINRAPSTALNIFLPLLDNRRTLRLDLAGGDDVRSVKMHDKCVVFATANIGARHIGTTPLDPSLTSRFLMHELENYPGDVEADILIYKCGIKKSAATHIVSIANATRQKVLDGTLDVELCPRDTIECASLVADGYPILKAMELAFLSKYEGAGSDQRSIVKAMFTTR